MNARSALASTVRKTTISSPMLGGDPLVYVMSDETVDRVGDVIEAKGWQLGNFLKNPVALFGHDHKFIVGHWTDVKVVGSKLIGKLNLLPAGISERLDEIRAAVEAGVLRAVSVGFQAASAEPNEHGGFLLRGAELMECSLVAVPANPNALQVAKSLNLSSEARSLIFGNASAHRATQAGRVVKLDGVTRACLNGTLQINVAPRNKPGEPFRIARVKTNRTVVVKLPAHATPAKPTRVVKLTRADQERARRKLNHRVVKLDRR